MSTFTMVKLVSVVRSDDYKFTRRQLPLVVDDNLTMVAQFNDNCVGCSQTSLKQQELERFVTRYHSLSSDEVAVALMVTNKEILELLSQLLPCVGCRKSVERLFGQLVSSGHPTLEPLILTPNTVLSIRREYLFDPKAIFALLYMHGSKVSEVMECIPKSKKNKRCQLHSLDSHKVRSLSCWADVWELLSDECREEVVLVRCNNLVDTMDSYLRKHRFCADCKSKVQHAYRILVKEVDHKNEKGYCAALYAGIKCCSSDGHLHLPCDTDYVRKLVERAEPELHGSRRERHAKTLDIAQEEVLTCLGIHLYERLHKIGQKLRAEEQTWQLLFYLGVDALRKNFEMALEKKQGISNLELMCQEILQEEKEKEQKRKQKLQKKKKNKKKKQESSQEKEMEDKCAFQCDENTNLMSMECNSCDASHAATSCQFELPQQYSDHKVDPRIGRVSAASASCDLTRVGPCASSNRSDCGYSSEGGEVLSLPSSREGSDVACSEGICNHDGDVSELMNFSVCNDCSSENTSPKHTWSKMQTYNKQLDCTKTSNKPQSMWSNPSCTYHCRCDGGDQCSLLDMLQGDSCEEDEGIPAEDIEQFRANKSSIIVQRNEYRQRLRKQFASLTVSASSTNVACSSDH